MKNRIIRLLSVLMIVLLTSAVVPLTAFAAVNPVDGKISVEASGASSGPTLNNGSVVITEKGSLFNGGDATITIENVGGSTANIQFDYALSGKGSATLNGASVTSGTYKGTVAANGTVSMGLKGTSGLSPGTGTLTLSNFKWTAVSESAAATVTFDSAYGSVTVGGASVTSGASVAPSGGELAAVATPASGCSFLGWVNADTHEVLSTAASATLSVPQDMNIEAVFAGSGSKPYFGVGKQATVVVPANRLVGRFEDVSTYYVPNVTVLYDNLLEAVSYASASADQKYIVLMNSGTLPAGNYTIPSGVTLLVPFDGDNLLCREQTSVSAYGAVSGAISTANPYSDALITFGDRGSTVNTVYRTLTLASGAHITVNGALEVSGQTDVYPVGTPIKGKHSVIQMNSDSSITVNGTLYAWGAIKGSGTVTVNSGAEVYETLVITDYTGDANVMNEINVAGAFPLREFVVDAVQVPLTLKYGGNIRGFFCIYGNLIGYNTFIIDFAGTEGVFKSESGDVEIYYQNSRQKVNISGHLSLNQFLISLSAAGVSATVDSSASSGLPVGKDWDVVVESGGTLTAKESAVMFAGATLLAEEGANLDVASGKQVVILDAVTDPSAVEKDAVLDIRGTATANGIVYTATNAAVKSSGNTGSFTVADVGADKNIVLRSGSSTAEVAVNPAKLQNSDPNSIVETANGGANIYTYTEGFWRCATHSGVDTDHTCDVCGYVTACADTNGDSFCDICGKNLCTHESMTTTEAKSATCEDPGNYAYWYCAACQTYFKDEEGTAMFTEEDPYIIPALTHKDENPKDHICDNGCEVYQGTHADGDDNDHLCDYCNGTVEGDVCVDNNNDHNCDECGTSISVCVDEGKDHKCDICGENVGTHEAAQGTHICAYCNQNASDCDYTVRGDIVTEANCVTKAVYKAKCSVCDAVSETKTITGEVDSRKHTGNTDVRNAKSATCAAEGYTGDTHCSDCGVKLQNGTTTEKLTTHTYPETWTQTKAPTCTEKGSEERKCTVEGCDATETREVKELDHDWATTLTRGETTHWYGCSRCDAKNGEATHSYDWEVTKEATCYQDGSKSGTCSCGATATEVIDATSEHTYSETYTTENGSHWRACTTTGCTEKTDVGTCSDATTDSNHNCDVCGKENVTSHEYDKKVVTDAYKATDATCSAKATYYFSCNCGEKGTETFEDGEMLDHSFGDWTTVTAATCMAVGEQRRDCEHCEHYETAEIAKDTTVHTGNNTTGVNAKAATCTETGYTGDTLCECGVTVEHGEDIPATGHKNTETVGYVAATCGAAGYTGDKFCNDCETAIATGEVIQATGDHIYTWTTTATATCVAKGVETGTCSCGATTTRDMEINPNAHNLVTVEAKTATCTQSGWNAYEYCDREGCRYTTYVEIPATNSHSDSETDNDHICDTCDKVMTECSGGTASCTKKAVCTTCGEEYGELADHSYTTKASTSVKSVATCKDVAVYWAQCDNCTAVSETVTVNGTEKAPDNHVGGTEEIAEVPATCQTAGTTAGTKCLGCNTVISGCTEIAKQACADTDSDHICNNGCDQKLSECADNDTDHDCDVCGAEMGTHEAAEGKHTCDYCGETVTQCDDSDDADHYCDVCGEVVGSHTYGTEWKTDGTNHWHECACGEKSDLDGHSYDDGVVTKEPTTEAEGEMTYTCEVCGNKKTETLGKVEEKVIYGDVDGDGYVTSMDATDVLLYVARLIQEIPETEADVDGDGYITSMDATEILLYVAKLITEFTVETTK